MELETTLALQPGLKNPLTGDFPLDLTTGHNQIYSLPQTTSSSPSQTFLMHVEVGGALTPGILGAKDCALFTVQANDKNPET